MKAEGIRPRVLIADDREENRYILQRVLDATGYDCATTSTGHGVLEIALTLPDIIILDVHLPDVSGLEVCRQIKADPRTAAISVLQISASFIASEDKVRSLDAGADGYLTHPIDRTVLIATVRGLLRLRTAEVTARKTAEYWQAAFDSLTEGLALIDDRDRMIRWNQALTRICGSGFPLQTGDAAVFLERLLGSSALLENLEKRNAGEFTVGNKTLQASVNRVDTGTIHNEKILILADITDRKLAEYALRTAEKLAATGRLASAIAHEINNPLEALTNLIYLAGSSESIENIHELLSHANLELERVARITKQALAFHRDTQSPILVDVGNLVSDIVALHERSAATRRVSLKCNCSPTSPVQGFPGQLSQVFSNLIRNAAEAAPPETAVDIRVRTIFRLGNEGARITIHDRGSGISDQVKARIFDPFFTTKALKGSGLGLWVSRSIVSKHGGTIRFRSSVRTGASGTTFEVFLPQNAAPRALMSEDWNASAQLQRS